MRALLSGRAGLAISAYTIGWMLAPVLAIGQAPRQEQDAGVTVIQSAPPAPSIADVQLAAWLIVDHESEISICQHAQGRLQDETVRRFLQIVVQDHTRLIQNLRPFSGTMLGQWNRAARSDALGAPSTRRPAANAVDETSRSVRPSAGQFPPLREPSEQGINKDTFLLQVKRELGQQRVLSTQAMFDARDRDEFDQCFLGEQVATHRELLDTLTVCRQHATGRFALVLDEAIAQTKAHLDHAEQLADKLDSTEVTAFLPLTFGE
ncbi:MAG: hypothetical protein KF708_14820 [Pirellulales bacterium]|nr:hypothetical protein [Pirellulales bacterium]